MTLRDCPRPVAILTFLTDNEEEGPDRSWESRVYHNVRVLPVENPSWHRLGREEPSIAGDDTTREPKEKEKEKDEDSAQQETGNNQGTDAIQNLDGSELSEKVKEDKAETGKERSLGKTDENTGRRKVPLDTHKGWSWRLSESELNTQIWVLSPLLLVQK